MSEWLTEAEGKIVGQILKAERTIPDDMMHVEAVQSLATLLAKYGAVMTKSDYAQFIGIGALIARQGKAEMMADIQGRMLMGKIRGAKS